MNIDVAEQQVQAAINSASNLFAGTTQSADLQKINPAGRAILTSLTSNALRYPS